MESAVRDAIDQGLKVIETLRLDPEMGPVRLDRHMARCARTCAMLGYPFDRAQAETRLRALSTQHARGRMTVDRGGALEVTATPLDWPIPQRVWRVALSEVPLQADDPFLPIKTTQRALYDQTLRDKAEGIDEVLFFNEAGLLCEGCYTNVFLEMPDGRRLTPAASAGLLPGILREELLEAGAFAEADITRTDLLNARQVWVGNSLRGLNRADVVQ